MLIVCAVIAVAGKTVELPDKNGIERPFGAVFYHAKEVQTLFGFLGRRQGAVDILANNSDTLLLGIFPTLANLPLDRLLPLAVRRKAGIYHCDAVNLFFHSTRLLPVRMLLCLSALLRQHRVDEKVDFALFSSLYGNDLHAVCT